MNKNATAMIWVSESSYTNCVFAFLRDVVHLELKISIGDLLNLSSKCIADIQHGCNACIWTLENIDPF